MKYYVFKALRIVILAALGFLAWQVGPVLVSAFLFSGDLDLYALDAANARASEDRIHRFILTMAEKRGLLIHPQDIRVQVIPEERTVKLNVDYRVAIDLFGIRRMELDFHPSAKRHALPTANEIEDELKR